MNNARADFKLSMILRFARVLHQSAVSLLQNKTR